MQHCLFVPLGQKSPCFICACILRLHHTIRNTGGCLPEDGHWYNCGISVKDLRCFDLPICFSWLRQHCESYYILKSHLLQLRKEKNNPPTSKGTIIKSIFHHGRAVKLLFNNCNGVKQLHNFRSLQTA